MEQSRLKQRLVGMAVLIALAVVFVPMLLETETGPRQDLGGSPIPPKPTWDFGAPATPTPGLSPPREPETGRDAAPSSVVQEPQASPPAVGQPSQAGGQGVGDTGAAEVSAKPEPPAEPEVAVSGQAAAPSSEPRDEVADEGNWRSDSVKPGDTLYAIFARAGLGASEVRAVMALGASVKTLNDLRPGQRFRLQLGSDGKLRRLIYQGVRGGTFLELVRGTGGFRVEEGGEPVRPAAVVTREAESRSEEPKGSRPTPAARSPRATPSPVAAEPPARPPAVPSAAAGASTGAEAWVVQLASLNREQNALALRDSLRAKGFPAFLESLYGEQGKLWRVRVGPELARSSAEVLRARLEREAHLQGLVVPYP